MTRKFGVELEISRRLVNAAYSERGKKAEWAILNSHIRSLYDEGAIGAWKVKPDSSCGGEIVSPILQGDNGLRQVAIVCKAMHDFIAARGITSPLVDGECGLHIHFEARDLSAKQIGNLFSVMHSIEPILFLIFSNRNFAYCSPITINPNLFSRIRDITDVRSMWYTGSNNIKKPHHVYPHEFINNVMPGEHYDGTRYHGLNIHCLWDIGTVEFRYAAGTFDFEKFLMFYNICAAAMNLAISTPKVHINDTFRDFTYSKLVNHLSKDFRMRAHLITTLRNLNLPLLTKGVILRELRKNDNLPPKHPDSIITFITDKNASEYAFKSNASGVVYSYSGERIRATIVGKVIPCDEYFDKKTGKLSLISSKKNIKMNPIVVKSNRKPPVVVDGGFWPADVKIKDGFPEVAF